MNTRKHWVSYRFVMGWSIFLLVVMFTTGSLAQVSDFGGVGGENPDAESSRTPFRIRLRGIVNGTQETSRRVLKLRIGTFNETYDFDLEKAEAVDNPHVSEYAILQQVGKYAVDFDLIGPRELLSKVGQANPGTPLRIVGFFTQRNRKLQLESVDIAPPKPQ